MSECNVDHDPAHRSFCCLDDNRALEAGDLAKVLRRVGGEGKVCEAT